jgi:hypothetical protein
MITSIGHAVGISIRKATIAVFVAGKSVTVEMALIRETQHARNREPLLPNKNGTRLGSYFS